MHLKDLKRLAGLTEQFFDDEDDRLDHERYAREKKITSLIALAFRRIGLSIFEDSDIIYLEDQDREAIVKLEDSDVDLDVLMKLKESGLSDRFEIGCDRNGLTVSFIVSPELDNAVLPTRR